MTPIELSSDVRVRFVGEPDALEVVNAVEEVGPPEFQDRSVIPTHEWRPADVGSEARGGTPSSHRSNTVLRVRVPKKVVAGFERVTAGVLTGGAVDVRRHPFYGPALQAFTMFLDGITSADSRPDLVVDGIQFRPPDQRTVSADDSTGLRVGLHVDTWDLDRRFARYTARNRIAVNLSGTPRWLLFVPFTYTQIREWLPRSERHDSDPRGLVLDFFRTFPSGPVYRLRIDPGMAYVAPTENLIHDASSLGGSALDTTLHARGFFEPSALDGLLC